MKRCQNIVKFTKICQNLSKFVKIYQNFIKVVSSKIYFAETLSFINFWALYKERSQKNISEIENLKPEISSPM